MAMWLACAAAIVSATEPAAASDAMGKSGGFFPVESFPKTLPKDCRDGKAKLYDECGSQFDVVKAAVAQAKTMNKTPLIVYGGEWCVWCFVFDAAIRGEYQPSYYVYALNTVSKQWEVQEKTDEQVAEQAKRLNQYVFENFVVAHIESHVSPDGAAAIDATGFNSAAIEFYPAILSLTTDGDYADHFFAYVAMAAKTERKDKQGQKLLEFDRLLLLEQLQRLKQSAMGK